MNLFDHLFGKLKILLLTKINGSNCIMKPVEIEKNARSRRKPDPYGSGLDRAKDSIFSKDGIFVFSIDDCNSYDNLPNIPQFILFL